jgi:hypothetical protein
MKVMSCEGLRALSMTYFLCTPLTPELPCFLELVFSDPIKLAISLRLEICQTHLPQLTTSDAVTFPDSMASADVNLEVEGTASAEVDSRGAASLPDGAASADVNSGVEDAASVEVDSLPDSAASADVNLGAEGTTSMDVDSGAEGAASMGIDSRAEGTASADIDSKGAASAELNSERGCRWELAGLSLVIALDDCIGFGVGGVEGSVGPC